MTAFFGGYEIWVVLVVALLLFGHRIPKMARSLGGGIVEFKKGLRGEDSDEKLPPPSTPSGIPPGTPSGSPASGNTPNGETGS